MDREEQDTLLLAQGGRRQRADIKALGCIGPSLIYKA